MRFQLVDKSEEMCAEWIKNFHECEDVIIHHGDFFSLKTDCVVSPANSFGFMDGSLDLVISETLGWQVQTKLQILLNEKYNGELLVGQAVLVETDNKEIPYCISAPTMRIPMLLTGTVNVYLAAKAIFRVLKENKDKINIVTISGLGTGVGRVPFSVCANQMKQAYDDIWLDKDRFPEALKIAMVKHKNLLIYDYTNRKKQC